MLTFRALAPTPEELLAHARAHPLLPGSDAAWWLLYCDGVPRLFAMRPWWAGAVVLADGRWVQVPRRALLRPRESIAPLRATGDGAEWPLLTAGQLVEMFPELAVDGPDEGGAA